MTPNLVSFTVRHAHSEERFQENTKSALCAVPATDKKDLPFFFLEPAPK